MGDERDDRETPEPARDDLERAEAEFFAELAKDRRVPFEREVVRADVLEAAPTEDFLVSDLFDRTNPYLKDDGRISHVLVRWRGAGGEPTHLLEWWAPYVLLRPEELAETEYEGDLDPLIVERGVAEGAVLAKEDFMIEAPEEGHRILLGLGSGMVTRFRDLTFEKRHGGSNEYEI